MLKTVEYHSWTFPRLNEGSPKKSTESHEARHDRSQSKLLLYEDSRISGKGGNRDDGEDGEDRGSVAKVVADVLTSTF